MDRYDVLTWAPMVLLPIAMTGIAGGWMSILFAVAVTLAIAVLFALNVLWVMFVQWLKERNEKEAD